MAQVKKKKKRKKQISHGPITTPAYKKLFLEKLAAGNMPTVAAKLAGISRSTVFGWKKEDQEFASAWDDAIEAGVDKVETALIKRAIKDDTPAALAFLRAYRPERYARKDGSESRNNFILNITVAEHNKRLERLGLPVPVIESDLEDDAPAAITHNP
jgi:hypothetical protein